MEHLVLSAADNQSGTARIEYKIGWGDIQEYTQPLEMTPETSYLRYRAVDAAGNTEIWQRLDWRRIRRPRTSCRVEGEQGNDGWYRTIPQILIEAAGGTILDRISYSLNGGEQNDYTGMLQPETDGYHTLSWNAAGEGRTDLDQSKVIKIDRTAPECKRSLKYGENYITFELTAWDEHSGIQRTEYRLNGGPVMIYHGAVDLTAGSWSLEYRSIDRAGNEGEWQQTSIYMAGRAE